MLDTVSLHLFDVSDLLVGFGRLFGPLQLPAVVSRTLLTLLVFGQPAHHLLLHERRVLWLRARAQTVAIFTAVVAKYWSGTSAGD